MRCGHTLNWDRLKTGWTKALWLHPEPCTRRGNPPKQQCLTSDFLCPTDLCQICQLSEFCHRSLAAPDAERGVPSTPTNFLREGEGGARLAIARLGRVPSWPCTGYEPAKPPLWLWRRPHWLDRLKADRQRDVTRWSLQRICQTVLMRVRPSYSYGLHHHRHNVTPP